MTKQQAHKLKYGANHFSASKLYRGKQLTVRMVDPDTSKGIPVSGFRFLVHRNSFKVKKLTPVFGNYLPSRFEVENFGCKISFTLEEVTGKQGRSPVQITELCCSQGVTLQLPLALLRTLALQACTFSAYLLPPHFTYKPSPNVTISTDKEGGFQIVGSANLPPRDSARFTQP